MLDIYWSMFCFFVAILGCIYLIAKGRSNDDSAEFNAIFTIFSGVTLAFSFLYERAVETGLFGLRDILSAGSIELQSFTLVMIAVAAWIVAILVLIFGSAMFMDDELNFTLRKLRWFNRFKTSEEEVINESNTLK